MRFMPISVARSPLELIGHTPVVRLNRLPGKDDAEVWAKLENYNPGGSVKDRICLAMIERAEREGRIKPGDTIVEPTSGNTGIGLALVCAVKGYKLTLTMPDTMSEERRSLLAAYGATLVLTPDTRGMHGAIAKAEELVRANPGYFMPQQFSNPANPEIHYQTTGPELVEQLARIDAFVAGVGTGGTISGTGRYLREKLPNRPLIVAVEPKNSPVLEGGEAGFHKIQGIGAGFVPTNLDTTVYDEVIAVSDEDATTLHAPSRARRGPAGRNFLGRKLLRRAPGRQAVRQGQNRRRGFLRYRRALSDHRPLPGRRHLARASSR